MITTGRKYLRFIFLAALALFVMQLQAQAATDPEVELEPFELYFREAQLVEVATRAPKPITQIAENVTVVTAEEIERMHAHTVGEVLNRVGGVFFAWFGQDFGSSSLVSILGSREHHTLALLDGVRINNASGGTPMFNFIPIGIVKRIEIIKGPASSTWGSALGGVVNIITKDTGNTLVPVGSFTATYGEAASYEVAADAARAVGTFSYFLHDSATESDGLKFDRFFNRQTFYGKFRFALPGNASLNFTGGYSNPHFRLGNFQDLWGVPGLDAYEVQRIRHFWGTVYLDLPLAERWNLHLALQRYNQHFFDDDRSLGTGSSGVPLGADLFNSDWEEHTTTAEGRLSWRGERVNINLGAETSRARLDLREDFPAVPALGWAAFRAVSEPVGKEERRGIYANATWTIDDFSLTPGIRYDFSSTSEEFVSPSFGATWMVLKDTLLRASVARGFSSPYLASFAHSPDLHPEEIWSYNAGIETGCLHWATVKATAFHQNVEEIWNTDTLPWTNTGRTRWNGMDFEVRSTEFKGFSTTANFSFIVEDSVINKDGMLLDLENEKLYGGNLTLDYVNRSIGLKAQLAGHYVHWYEYAIVDLPADDSWLWDVSVSKGFDHHHWQSEVFMVVHNITNASQYWDFAYENPDRWVEAGIKINL